MTAKTLRIGVFVPNGAQLLDLSCIDLFAMLQPSYLAACSLPSPLVALGIPSTIEYISLPTEATHIALTASVDLRTTKSTKDADVQPGMLDIVLVPGPDPSSVYEEAALEFLRGHDNWKGEQGKRTDVLSVCTGCFLMAESGILKGKSASGPRALVPDLRKKFPDTKWNDDRRWVVEGNIWTSGGITNGQEMVAAYMREKFPGPSTEAVLAMSGCGEKGIDYTSSTTGDNIWWFWQIMRAVIRRK